MNKNLIKGVLLGLGVVYVMFTNTTNAYAEVTPGTDGDISTLTVCGHDYNSDTDGCITMMDRNLGATSNDITSSDSYGNYYQRGNNYGFPNNGSITTSYDLIDCSDFGPLHPFNSSTFIIYGVIDYFDYCSPQNDNMWGGGNDNSELVYPVENESERRGPCPENYHVPSQGEWYALMDMWAGESVEGRIEENISQFQSDFKIPFAGHRLSYNGSVGAQGNSALLWSSSPYIYSEASWYFSIGHFYIEANSDISRGDGHSVRCFKDSDIGSSSSESGPSTAQIILSVEKGILRIGNTDSILNLGEVNVSNSAQELSGSFGANSFWVEDMKGVESGYYTTISVTDLTGSVAGHVISANNVSLKTAGNEPSYISGANVNESKVVFGEGITTWHSGSGAVNYFMRENTSTANAGRVGKWGDNLQIKVNIPAHTPYDTYRGTITYTLYDNDN